MLIRFIRRSKFLRDFNGKFKAGIDLKIQDILLIAKVRGIDPADVKVVLRRLLSDARDPKLDEKIMELLNALENHAPFSEFPSEVRYSLTEIQALLDANEVVAKECLLAPILQNIAAHETLKERNSIVGYFVPFALVFLLMHLFWLLGLYVSTCNP